MREREKEPRTEPRALILRGQGDGWNLPGDHECHSLEGEQEGVVPWKPGRVTCPAVSNTGAGLRKIKVKN